MSIDMDEVQVNSVLDGTDTTSASTTFRSVPNSQANLPHHQGSITPLPSDWSTETDQTMPPTAASAGATVAQLRNQVGALTEELATMRVQLAALMADKSGRVLQAANGNAGTVEKPVEVGKKGAKSGDANAQGQEQSAAAREARIDGIVRRVREEVENDLSGIVKRVRVC
jgi:hypothetical protein